jgi:hypothetical protein
MTQYVGTGTATYTGANGNNGTVPTGTANYSSPTPNTTAAAQATRTGIPTPPAATGIAVHNGLG